MSSSSLAAITALKKLVNHPDLIHEHCREKKEGFEKALQHYPQVHSIAVRCDRTVNTYMSSLL